MEVVLLPVFVFSLWNFVPNSLVGLYETLMWWSGPSLLVVEAIQMVAILLFASRLLTARILEHEKKVKVRGARVAGWACVTRL